MSPGGPGVRLDTIAYKGYTIPPFYDSMIGKLIVFAIDWEGAVRKAERALCEYVIEGIPTNLTLHRQIVKDDDFKNATFNTGYLPEKLDGFDLNETDNRKSEEEKHKQLSALIESIKNNQVKVRQ